MGAIGFGCMALNWEYGSPVPDDWGITVIRRAVELGATLLDTADVYAEGANERLLGSAIAGCRGEVTISTKGGLVLRDRATFATEVDGSPDHLQSELSLWTREPLDEIVPWCAVHDVAFIPYAPLGRGFLAGRFSTPDQLPAGDFRRLRQPRFVPDAFAANLPMLERLRSIAGRLDATPAQVALAWLLAQGEHVVPIPSTKSISRLAENVAASELQLSAEDLAELEQLPRAVGPRY